MTTAQIQASDPAYSVWVAASAGTGKTTVLTSRVLRLLLGGTNPGKILCLTYTNAGAAEMESRIKAKLCNWVILPEDKLIDELTKLTSARPNIDVINRARRLFLETLDTPDGIKIQTIHSFCQGLMRRFPLEAGIVPHFKVMDDKTAQELLKEARVRLLSDQNAYTPEIKAAIDNIFWRIREGAFSDVIANIINNCGKLEKAITQSGGVAGLKRAIFTLLEVEEGVTEEEIRQRGVLEVNFNRKDLHAVAVPLLNEKGKTFVERGNKICSWLELDEEGRLKNFNDYKDIFLTQQDEPRKSLLPAKTSLPSEPLEYEQERIYRLIKNIKKTRLAILSSSMVDIANALLEFYIEEKSGKAYLDYNDLIMKAESLLTGTDIAPWVLYKLDGGIDHLLLDEAQDTSPEQWHIIDSICSEFFSGSGAREVERTIFIVGDEKQSIYSFQGAAPQIFNRMQGKFQQRVENAGNKWRNIRLDESFRSAPMVLEAVNKVRWSLVADRLSSIEDSNDDKLQTINDQRSYHQQMYGKVEIWPIIEYKKEENQQTGWVMPLEYKDKQDPKKILAEKIADEIDGWLKNGRILKSEGRAVCAGDIMILLRKRTDMADNIISSLKKRRVPVAGHDRLVLTEHIAVMDLMALGNFLLLPDDCLSLACVLKSPLIGFSEEDLFQIAYGRGKKSLWQAMKENCHCEEPTEGGATKQSILYKDELQNQNRLPRHTPSGRLLAMTYSYLTNLLNKVDYLTPFALYCYILEALGGRKQLVQRLGYEINDPVDEFLSLALSYEKSHAPSLQGFLSWLASGQSQIKRDMEQGNAGTVRVMTVHGSKGLEAPIVILPDTTTVPDTKNLKIFWHDDENAKAFLWPGGSDNEDEICKTIKQREKKAQEEEYYRLLYVAMTRAKSELYIAGSVGKKNKQEGCWYDVIFNAISHKAEKNEDGVLRLVSGTPAILKENKKPETEDKIILPQYLLKIPMPEPSPTRPLTPSNIEEEKIIGNSSFSNIGKIQEGKIIHSLLEFLPDFPEDQWLSMGQKFLERKFAISRTSESGITDSKDDEITRILQNIISIMKKDELKDLFGINSRAEVPVVGIVGGEVVSGRIDRLAVLEGKVIIVDYKTGRIPPLSASKISKTYIRQMQAYKNIMQEIYQAKTIECYILWTEGCVVFNVCGDVEESTIKSI